MPKFYISEFSDGAYVSSQDENRTLVVDIKEIGGKTDLYEQAATVFLQRHDTEYYRVKDNIIVNEVGFESLSDYERTKLNKIFITQKLRDKLV